MHIEILSLPDNKKKTKYSDSSTLGFGKIFTDRMFFVEWKSDKGWFNAQIKPYEPFSLDPSCLIFHYGQEVFEGLKAYKWKDGSICLFRPEMNAKRFNFSAERMCMPTVPEDFFIKAISELIVLEKEWVPEEVGTSLYIRPTMIAVDNELGVRPSSHYYFYIILSPVSSYYSAGLKPIKLFVEDEYIRAAPGGTGEAKTSCNYGGSLKALQKAKAKGFDQVLWLDSHTKSYIEEAGAMNIFFVYDDYLLTAPLEGSILHGVTRDSVLKLGKDLGLSIVEKRLSMKELMHAIQNHQIKEVFCSGTAAIINPVGVISYQEETAVINEGKIGNKTLTFYEHLTGIQYGLRRDNYGWIKKIC